MLNLVSCKREELPGHYQQCVKDNPLLGRIEEHAKTLGWSDEEIRTFQLLAACGSNASMAKRIKELEEACTPRT